MGFSIYAFFYLKFSIIMILHFKVMQNIYFLLYLLCMNIVLITFDIHASVDCLFNEINKILPKLRKKINKKCIYIFVILLEREISSNFACFLHIYAKC